MSTPLPALYQCVVCREPATLNVLGMPGGSRWYCAAHAPPELSFVSKGSLDAALAETARLEAPSPPSRLAVTVDDPHGDIASVSLLSESRDAVVYLIELARKRAEIGMWTSGGADSATAYLEGEEVPLATITFTGLDMGENPLCRAQTVRYGCVVTIARNEAGGHERSLYTRPK